MRRPDGKLFLRARRFEVSRPRCYPAMVAGARLRRHDRIGIIAIAAHLDIARLRGCGHRRCEERSDEATQRCSAAWIASLALAMTRIHGRLMQGRLRY